MKRVNSQKGFALVDVMVSVALVGASVAAVTGATTQFNSMISRSKALDNATSTVEQVRSALAQRAICKANLAGLASVPGTEYNLPSQNIRYFNDANVSTGVAAAVGDVNGPYSLEKITFTPKARVSVNGPTEYFMNEVKLSFTDSSSGLKIERFIPVMTLVVNNLVDSCYANVEPDSVLGEANCSIDSNGLQVWDPVTETCVDRPTYKVVGTRTSAACNPGDRATGCGCDPPVGWENDLPPNVYTLPDGTTVSEPIDACSYVYPNSSVPNNTCIPGYDPRTDTSGFLAFANCMVGGG